MFWRDDRERFVRYDTSTGRRSDGAYEDRRIPHLENRNNAYSTDRSSRTARSNVRRQKARHGGRVEILETSNGGQVLHRPSAARQTDHDVADSCLRECSRGVDRRRTERVDIGPGQHAHAGVADPRAHSRPGASRYVVLHPVPRRRLRRHGQLRTLHRAVDVRTQHATEDTRAAQSDDAEQLPVVRRVVLVHDDRQSTLASARRRIQGHDGRLQEVRPRARRRHDVDRESPDDGARHDPLQSAPSHHHASDIAHVCRPTEGDRRRTAAVPEDRLPIGEDEPAWCKGVHPTASCLHKGYIDGWALSCLRVSVGERC